MKLLLVAAVSLSLALPLMAAPATPFPDVPAKQWAAASVQSIAQKKLMTALPDGQFHGDKPVTRYELAVVLDRFVRYMEAGKKPLSPTPMKPAATLPPLAPPDARAALTHLTTQGFLPLTSPLLTRPGTHAVTAQELADALSQVTIRLSDRSLPPTAH